MSGPLGLVWILVLAVAIIAGSITVNWIAFSIFQKLAIRLGGEWPKSPGLTLVAPAVAAGIFNVLIWLAIFSLLF